MHERDPFTPDRLFCPGPTPVPKAAIEAASATDVYHRSEDFYRVFRACREKLTPVFGTKQTPLILTSSGTGAMEAAVVNLTEPGDEVVVINGGKFGERWDELSRAYGCHVETLALEWGEAADPEAVVAAVKRLKNPKAVFFQANETSTGVAHPVQEICERLRETFDGFIIVDAISALGAHPMEMDRWGIDCVVAGSQKGFGIPPGLAFISLSEKAWEGLSSRPRFYFDLRKEQKGQDKGRSAFTPATSLIFSLNAALDKMHEAGTDRLVKHHYRLAEAARAAAKAMGLELLPKNHASNALTAMQVPEGVDGVALLTRLRERFGFYYAGGQDRLKGKIIRLAHLGFVSRFDLIDGVAGIEFALAEEGVIDRPGDGVKAAMSRLNELE